MFIDQSEVAPDVLMGNQAGRINGAHVCKGNHLLPECAIFFHPRPGNVVNDDRLFVSKTVIPVRRCGVWLVFDRGQNRFPVIGNMFDQDGHRARFLIETVNIGTGGSEVGTESLKHLCERFLQLGFSDQGFETGAQSRPAGKKLIELRHVDGGFDDIGQVSERIEYRLGGYDEIAPQQSYFPLNRPPGFQGFFDRLNRSVRERRRQELPVFSGGQLRRRNAEEVADRGIGADQLSAIVVKPDRNVDVVKHQLPLMVGLLDRVALAFRNLRHRNDVGATAHDPLVDIVEDLTDVRIRDEKRTPQLVVDKYRRHNQ